MSQNPVIGARGVYDNPSQFASMPEGALVTGSNVYIDRDFLITSRRGFNILTTSGLKSYKFFYFKDTFMSISSVFLKYSTDTWTANSLTAYNPTSANYPVMMGISNNNAYIPYQGYLTNSSIDYPVFKLEDPSATYNTSPKPGVPLWQIAGMPNPSTIIAGSFTSGTPTWLNNNEQVAYRACFGYRDSNNNLIIGGVSSRAIAVNTSGVQTQAFVSVTLPGVGGSGLVSGTSYSNNFPILPGYHRIFVYRSPVVSTSIIPSDDMKLVYEAEITAANYAANGLTIIDRIVPGAEGAPLYTNDSQEGISGNNSRLPHAKVVSNYKSMMIYANYKTQHYAFGQLLSVYGTVGLDANGYYRFWIESPTAINFDNRDLYIVQNILLGTQEFSIPIPTTGTVTADIEYTSLSMMDAINLGPMGTAIKAEYISNDSSLPGQMRFYSDYQFHIIGMTALSQTAFGVAARPVIKIVLGAGTVNTTNGNFTYAGHGFQTGDFVCVLWDTPTNATGTNPGAVTVSTIPYWIIYVDANNFRLASSQANAFAGTPIVPTTTGAGTLTFAAPMFSSGNNLYPNFIAPSKTNRPEEVAMAYALPVGAANFEILNAIQLRDTFFIFKEDGLWIATGEDHKNLSIQQFDPTCILVAIDSVALLNNSIFALSRKGVVKITENGVDTVSDMIRTPIQSIVTSIGSNYNLKISGTAYESENKYYLSIPSSVSSEYGGKTRVYNTLTNTWTTLDKYFTAGMVNINENKIHFGRDVNATAYAERKSGTYEDFCDEDLSVTISSITGNTIGLASASGVVVGDILYQSSTIWAYITAVSGNNVTVYGTPGFTAGARTVKKKFDQEVEYYPIHGGAPGVLKNFRDVTFHQQNPSYYKINYLFRSDYSGSEEGSEVSSDTWMNGTFGFGPFGGTPWGGISAEYNESPRVMIPRNKSKGTYLVPIVKMNYAFSQMNLAGLSLNFSSISERTRK